MPSFHKNKVEKGARFSLLEGTTDDFIDKQENKNSRANTDRDESLVKTFLQRKIKFSNIEKILLAQLKELLSELILTVRIIDVNDYEHTSMRGMIVIFERYLERKKLSSLQNHQ